MSPRTTGFIALVSCFNKMNQTLVYLANDHSVPKKVTPGGESRKTSQPFTFSSAPATEMSLFPASSCNKVDFPAVMYSVCKSISLQVKKCKFQTSICSNKNSTRTRCEVQIEVHKTRRRERVVRECQMFCRYG